jgi:non-ribosomal peptide synthase protein (TIGR01720 family)
MVPSLWIVFHALPLLPSGKLDRRRVVKSVETMDDETYRQISNAEEETQDLDLSEVERQFQTIFGQVLNLPENKIGKTKSFLHLGGDSISAMQVQARCKSAGLGVTVQDIIRAKSIDELASKVSSVRETTPQDEATERRFNLSPIQKFFFDTVGDDFVRFNQSGPVLRLSRKFPHEDIERAASSITKAHSMLRARFDRTAGKSWSQRITNDVAGSYRFRSYQIETSHQIASRTEESQASLNAETGPLWSVDVFNVSEDNSQLLFLVAHHLVIDIVSWHVVLGDLEGMLSGGQQVPQSLPFQSWSGQQEDQALKDFSSTVYPFKGCPTADLKYWGLSQSSNSNEHVTSDCFELEPTHSLLLLGANDALNTEALDIFIASLLESFGRAFTDRTIPPIFNEGHGRETLSANQDLSRTIGWFTALFPIYVAVDPGEETDILSTIRWVRDFRSRVPQSGRPYFAYSMLRGATDNPFRAHFPMEIAFNYLGKMQQHDRKDALFKPVLDISTGPDLGGNVPRFSIFEISASISRGCVSFTFSFPRDIKHQQKIGTWISGCKLSLQQAIDGLVRCRPDAETAGFPLLPLAYKGNEKLNQKLGRIGVSSAAALEDVFLSSPTQQGILLSQIRNPEHYIFRSIFEVLPASTEKPVDILRLRSAWSAVVARHQALKTFFIESSAEQGLMDQCVLREHNPEMSIFKCPDLSIPEIFQEHRRLNCRDPAPPHALAIAETSSSRVFCMLEMSHAISDGSSMGVLLEDLASAYDGKLSAKESATQFGEYIKYFYSAERETDLAYWRNYLKDATPCLFPILTDGIKGPNSQQCLEITFQDPAPVNQFCREHAVTVSSLLQLAWAVLLKTYVGSEQVAFGYVTSGRDIPLQGISKAVGCFVRIMICKIDFDDNMSILAGLECVQNDFITAMDHQRSSLADVQHEIQQQSLFNTAFTLQRQSTQHTAAEGLRFEVLDAMDPTEYAITLNAEVSNSRIGVSMTYATDIVCPAQAINIAETYQQIVHSIISSDLGQKLGDIEQLGECGLRRIKGWNMNLPERIDRCIHEIIAEQVHVRPSAQAVCAWDADLSFSELDSLSTNLAWMLQSLGVGVETPVPICFEKSAYAVVAMLGILKAGGAFVPIDGSHPESRLQMLIAELGARLVLCSHVFKKKLLTLASHATVVDEHTLRSLPNRVKPPSTGVRPSNLAYMIYTSGTTGVPKVRILLPLDSTKALFVTYFTLTFLLGNND